MKSMLRKKAMVLVLVFSMLTGMFGFTENVHAKTYSWMEKATLLPVEKIVTGQFTRIGEKIYCISVPEKMYLDLCVVVPGTKITGLLIYDNNGRLLKVFSGSRQWNYSKKDNVSLFSYKATFGRGEYYIGIRNYGKASRYAFTYYAKLSKRVNLKNIQRYSAASTKITWEKLSSVTGYEVYRATSLNGTYKRIAIVPASGNYCIDKSLRKGKSYYYIVRAYKMIDGKKIYSSNSITGKITLPK